MNGEPERPIRFRHQAMIAIRFARGDIDAGDSQAQRRTAPLADPTQRSPSTPRRLSVVDLAYRRVRTRFRRNLGGRAACGTREANDPVTASPTWPVALTQNTEDRTRR